MRQIDRVMKQIRDKEFDVMLAATKGEDTATLEAELETLRLERDDILGEIEEGGGE